VLTRLWKEIPWPYVEAYTELCERVKAAVPFPKVVVSAHMHWSTELFKIWLAEGAREGVKLVLCEHGGSFPPADYSFGWEERVADVYVPSYKCHHPKHVQLPPPKYVGVRPTSKRLPSGQILILPYTIARYTTRASSQPKSKQALDGVRQCIQLCEALPEHIKQKIRIKLRRTPPDYGYDLRTRFVTALGADAVLPDMELDEAFRCARLVVCTYPESTFAEAMLSGLPTVLFIDPRIHGIHPVAADDVVLLKRAHILFQNPRALASHVCNVWHALDTWWDGDDARAARKAFLRSTMNDEHRPLRMWRDFLRRVAVDGTRNPRQGREGDVPIAVEK
jgi:putative transferase (TIGR04331 family)